MPGTNNSYGQMFDQELNPRKGWGPGSPGCLEKVLEIKSGETGIYAGSVGYIDSNNDFVLGVASDSSLTIARPPLIAFQNQTDFDVNPDLGNIAGGTIMALSCLGDFELESTQITAAQTFLTGSYLTADSSGNIKTGSLGTDIILGIVSEIDSTTTDGSFENEHGQDVVRFWTYFAPSELTASA